MLLLSMLGLIAGCEGRIGYEAVTIRPGFGYAEGGCDTVQFSGHGFGEDAGAISATIGGGAVEDIVFPDPESNPLDIGFVFYGTIPGASVESGPVDVVVTKDGTASTIEGGFYYVACFSTPHIDAVAPTTGVVAGDSISVAGCNIVAGTQFVTLHVPTRGPTAGSAIPEGAGTQVSGEIALTSTCGDLYASFTAPDLPPGRYDVVFHDGSGGTTPSSPTGDAYPCFTETADTADTGMPGGTFDCPSAFRLTYGGA